MDDAFRAGILGNPPLVDDENPVGQSQCFFWVMGYNDGSEMKFPGNLLNPVFDRFFD